MTVDSGGLNLTALWTRLAKTWPSREASPRMSGQVGLDLDLEADPLAFGEGPQALDRFGRHAPHVRRRRGGAARPPLSIRARSSSSDTIWAMLPVSTSSLAIRSRIFGAARRRRPRVGVAGERLGQEADRRDRRSQLVRQVVDELGPDPLQPAELGDVLEDEPDAEDRRAAGADHEGRPVRLAERRPRPTPSRARAASRAMASIRWSTRASIAVRPSIEPGSRSRKTWAAVFATSTRRSSVRRTMPTPMRSAR